ncbi:FAD-dependent monooxygenase [Halomonas sp. A11-A]|uniref:FAD-dependent monooxygenase n=1 Tax=Halomonas sp. A11-A TaxID=2183985 RepID=UPI000D885FD1|nr:FAD-dependent monooxygenase [Halomonas sp. A11-A]PWV70003.1 FAD binding domain-containing protein [Halomonas sp. A11-A]
MQYFLDGYRSGDPRIQPLAEGRSEEQGPLPEEVDVLIVGTGPAGLLLAAQLSTFPGIVTRVVEKADGPLEVGRADGIACRTVEMFEAFGLAERMTTEAYWINETHFWGPAPGDTSRITRLGRVQDVRDGLSEFPHVIVNQARLLDFLLEYMHDSPSRLKVDYGHETLKVEVPENPDERVTVTLKTPEGEKTVRARYVVALSR